VNHLHQHGVTFQAGNHHVVYGLGGVGVARQPDTLGSHPAFQCGNQRLDPFLSDSMPLLTPGTVPTPEREVRIRLPGWSKLDSNSRSHLRRYRCETQE
jgi:hypothetical protein